MRGIAAVLCRTVKLDPTRANLSKALSMGEEFDRVG
jgi:hypothetical protein